MTTGTREEFLEAQRRMLSRYGVEAESRFIDVPSVDGRAHLLEVGEGAEVVVLNGMGTPAAMWAPLLAELDGLRLLAVDLPGYGLTDTGQRFADDLRDNAVAFLEDTLDALGLSRPAFLANSLGSLWTIWLTLDRPARVGPTVHVGCPGAAPDTVPPLPLRLQAVPVLGRLMVRLVPPSEEQVEGLAKMVREHPLPPELVDLLVATERLPGFIDTLLSTLRAMLRLRGYRPGIELTEDDLSRVGQPSLLVWGERDPFGPVEAGRAMTAALPDARFHRVEGGHAPWLDDARGIGEIAGPFLRQAAAGRA